MEKHALLRVASRPRDISRFIESIEFTVRETPTMRRLRRVFTRRASDLADLGHGVGSLARNSGARALVDRGLNRRQTDLWV